MPRTNQIKIMVEPEVYGRINAAARRGRRTISDWCRVAVEDALDSLATKTEVLTAEFVEPLALATGSPRALLGAAEGSHDDPAPHRRSRKANPNPEALPPDPTPEIERIQAGIAENIERSVSPPRVRNMVPVENPPAVKKRAPAKGPGGPPEGAKPGDAAWQRWLREQNAQ